MNPTKPHLRIALLAALAAGGCTPPLDPDTASDDISRQAGALARSTSNALTASGGIDRMASRARESLGALGGGPMSAVPLPRLMSPPAMLSDLLTKRRSPSTPETLPRVTKADDTAIGDAVAAAAGDLERAIKEQFLTRRNLESKNAFEAIYRLRPETTCRDPETSTVDEECRQLLARVELRLRVSAERAGHEIDLLVGRDHLRPLSLFIDEEGADLHLYLGQVKRAAQLVARALGEPDETPEVLAGTVRLSLKKDGSHKVAFSVGLLEMIELRDTGEQFAFRTAAARPALAIDVDGRSGAIDSRVDLGLTEISSPWRKDGLPARLVVPAISARAHFVAEQEEATFEQISLGTGPTFIEAGGTRVFQLDLNPRAGRAFNAEVLTGPAGLPRIGLTPGLGLTLMFNLAAVPSDQPPPAHLADETYQLLITPAAGSDPLLESLEDDQETLRVVQGQVQLSSSRVSQPLTAGAGQCLAPREPATGEHPVLGSLAVVPCP